MDRDKLLKMASAFTVWQCTREHERDNSVVVERRIQPDGSYLWAICNGSAKEWNFKTKEWSRRGLNSSLDDSYYDQHRVSALSEAILEAYIVGQQEHDLIESYFTTREV